MWMTGVCLLLFAVAATPAVAKQDVLKDPDGKTIAVILDCEGCPAPKEGTACLAGVENGFHDGADCGTCLLDANFGTRIPYAYDLHFTGYLKDENGKPLQGRFVRMFLPNTWSVRTRTADDGMFRLLFGATLERAGEPIVHDLGVRTMRADSKAPYYAFYMLPERHQPCPSRRRP